MKKKILEELGDDIAEEFSEEEARPQELETLDDSIIKPAHVLKNMWGTKKVWDLFLKRTAGELDRESFDKLRYGTYMLLTSNDVGTLAKFGYNKRDFVGVMSYLDHNFSPKPLSTGVKRAIAELGGTGESGPVELLSRVVSRIGRKVTESEAGRIFTWLKMLDKFEA
jgi:hypothetical protein